AAACWDSRISDSFRVSGGAEFALPAVALFCYPDIMPDSCPAVKPKVFCLQALRDALGARENLTQQRGAHATPVVEHSKKTKARTG
ncbi:MAG: hypothetical protein ACRD3E_06620, partial [Terriglobales bacterium]